MFALILFVQIIFSLLLGWKMRDHNATKIYLFAVVVCSIFNTLFFTVDLIDNSDLFLGVSVVMVALITLGDAGTSCSVYVLAGQHDAPFSGNEKEATWTSSGPALIETVY